MKSTTDLLAVYNELIEKAVYQAHLPNPNVIYLFDENKNEIGFYVADAKQFARKISRKWSDLIMDRMIWTKIK